MNKGRKKGIAIVFAEWIIITRVFDNTYIYTRLIRLLQLTTKSVITTCLINSILVSNQNKT